MKRVKFNKTVFLEGKPVWYKGCSYNVEKEWTDHGRILYGLIGEDLTMRGIDSQWATIDGLVTIEEIEDKKETEIKPETINKIEETKTEIEKPIEQPQEIKKVTPKKSTNKKRKSSKK